MICRRDVRVPSTPIVVWEPAAGPQDVSVAAVSANVHAIRSIRRIAIFRSPRM
jgi:hypothetical protein